MSEVAQQQADLVHVDVVLCESAPSFHADWRVKPLFDWSHGVPRWSRLQAWRRSISNPAARGRTIAQYVNKIGSESRAPVAYRQGSSIDGLGKDASIQ